MIYFSVFSKATSSALQTTEIKAINQGDV